MDQSIETMTWLEQLKGRLLVDGTFDDEIRGGGEVDSYTERGRQVVTFHHSTATFLESLTKNAGFRN